MSGEPRSCNLTNTNSISINFQNQNLTFPSIRKIEATIENLFLSQMFHNVYEAENFSSKIEGNSILICINGRKFSFDDMEEISEFEQVLCSLYSEHK